MNLSNGPSCFQASVCRRLPACSRRTGTRLLALGVGAAALFFFAYAYSPATIDDAPITWRYAENLAAGKGMVYNEGEYVQGTSTPLFTHLLALARLVSIPVPVAARALSIVSSLLAIAVCAALARTLVSERAAFWTGLLLITNGLLASQSSWGMETGLYVLLISLAFLLVARRRLALATLVASLCLLTRLDGLLVGVTILAAIAFQRRRVPWKLLALYAALALPWFLFAQIYYGSVLPQSMLAKMGHELSGGRLWLITAFFSPPIVLYLPFLLVGTFYLASTSLPSVRPLPLLAWSALYVLSFTLFSAGAYPWYFTPLLTLGMVVVAAGIERSRQLARRRFASSVTYPIFEILFLAALMGYTLYHGYETVSYWQDYTTTYEAQRIEIGRWLRDHTPPGSSVATAGIGHIGYYSERRIVDLGGLVTPLGGLYPARDWEDFEPDLLLYTIGGGNPEGDWSALKPSPMMLRWSTRSNERCDTLLQTWDRAGPHGGVYYLYRRRACP